MKMNEIKRRMDELKNSQAEKLKELEEIKKEIEQMKDKEMAEQGKMLANMFPNFEEFMTEYTGATKQEQAKFPEFIAQAIESWTETVAKERMEKSEAKRQKRLSLRQQTDTPINESITEPEPETAEPNLETESNIGADRIPTNLNL